MVVRLGLRFSHEYKLFDYNFMVERLGLRFPSVYAIVFSFCFAVWDETKERFMLLWLTGF
jgi:hypothetical protein